MTERTIEDEARLTPELIMLGVVVSLGALMMQLDMTMTNVATKTFLDDFGDPLTTIQWIGTGYLIAMATVIPIGGWAMERFGGRAVWMASLLLFMAGSTLCGLAWSAPSLIAFRVLQGLGGGLILPVGQSVMAMAAGPERMTKAMSIMGLTTLLGPVLGPVLGGVIVTDLSWRWIFFVNLPVCLSALALSVRHVPAARIGVPGGLDALGLGLLSGGSVALVYGFTEASRTGSFTATGAVIPMLAGIALLGAYVLHALYGRGIPVIDVRMLCRRAFGSSMGVLFLAMTVMFGTMGLLPLYYQQVRGQSALHAGLLLIPSGVGMGLSLMIASRSVERLGARTLAVGGLVVLTAVNFGLTRLDAGTPYLALGALQLVAGLGNGCIMIPVMATSLLDVTGDQVPRASTAMRVIQNLGGSLGGALLLVVLQNRITLGTAAGGGRPGPSVLGHAFGETFWWPLAVAVAALLIALILPRAAGQGVPEGGLPTPAPGSPVRTPDDQLDVGSSAADAAADCTTSKAQMDEPVVAGPDAAP
jgi:EmrB/QacA subfamily drug resistance transporter